MQEDTVANLLFEEWFNKVYQAIHQRWDINDMDFLDFSWIGFLNKK